MTKAERYKALYQEHILVLDKGAHYTEKINDPTPTKEVAGLTGDGNVYITQCKLTPEGAIKLMDWLGEMFI